MSYSLPNILINPPLLSISNSLNDLYNLPLSLFFLSSSSSSPLLNYLIIQSIRISLYLFFNINLLYLFPLNYHTYLHFYTLINHYLSVL